MYHRMFAFVNFVLKNFALIKVKSQLINEVDVRLSFDCFTVYVSLFWTKKKKPL